MSTNKHKFGNARVAGCRCEYNFTCSACLDYAAARDRLVSDAARATEHFTEDELEAAAQSYQGKLLDACETDEERIALEDYFAG